MKTTTALQDSLVINMKNILFVCTGNTCRSPMAQAIFNKLAEGKPFHAVSSGIYGDGISPISENAKLALEENGIFFSHTSTPVSKALLDEADIVICMSESHAGTVSAMFPEYREKIFVMPKDISDPYGGNLAIYRECLKEIEECIKLVIASLTGDKNEIV